MPCVAEYPSDNPCVYLHKGTRYIYTHAHTVYPECPQALTFLFHLVTNEMIFLEGNVMSHRVSCSIVV